MNNQPLITIIIVNWNGKKWLKQCLDSLLQQTYPAVEIIVVDNASTDGSREFISKHYKTVKLIRNATNSGFAGGNNTGWQHATGKYVLLLNNDTYIEPDFLRKFLPVFDKIPNLGSAQCKLVLMDQPEYLDVAGSYWTNSTFLYHYGYGKKENSAKYNKPLPFFSNKGAAMLLSRDIIEAVGLFDEDFWCYYEETDLCHRLWIAGYECWYYPSAKVYHATGGTSTTFDNSYIQFHNFKNKLLSFLKNFEARSLLTILPVYLTINIVLSFVWLLQGKPKHFFALYKGLWWNAKNLSNTLRKRRTIQMLRKVSDREIMRLTKRNPRLSYYYRLFNNTLKSYED